MATTTTVTTHEAYIQEVRRVAVASALARGTLTQDEATKLLHTKLVYGIGQRQVRGVCHYGTWRNGIGTVDTVEVAAAAQENWVQLTGTTLHELGHVLAGHAAGHGNAWKDACVRLGFTKRPEAAGQRYVLALLRADLRHAASALAQQVADGMPAFGGGADAWLAVLLGGLTGRPCSAGQGTRGGTSRGTGSGSRLRLWECECPRPVKVRVASDDFQAHCDACGAAFTRKGA